MTDCRVQLRRARCRRAGLLLAGLLAAGNVPAVDWPDANVSEWNREQKLVAANLAGGLFIIGWGVVNWDYFNNTPTAGSEGWFGADTEEGGADKLGHLYTNYVLTHGLSYLYGRWGYPRGTAARYGALSAFGLTGLMEVGDSFSSYGFSYEDMVMNTLGSVAGYLLWTRPDLQRLIDIRLEVTPRFDQADIFTDYENLKYLVALKFDGIDRLSRGPLRYLDLQLGYYARGYSQSDPASHERNLYVGVGLNLSRVFGDLSMRRTARVFNYLQLPDTHLDKTWNLNE
jgi:hypothetical protein